MCSNDGDGSGYVPGFWNVLCVADEFELSIRSQLVTAFHLHLSLQNFVHPQQFSVDAQ